MTTAYSARVTAPIDDAKIERALVVAAHPDDADFGCAGTLAVWTAALLRERVPGLTDDDYFAARDALVDDGLLARGKGRGGSIMRVFDDLEDEDEDAEEAWEGAYISPWWPMTKDGAR